MSPEDEPSPLSLLRDAAARGDLPQVTEALARLRPEELSEVFSLSFDVRAQPRLELELLLWVTEQPEPFPDSSRHTSWLRAMNNACLRASSLDALDEPRVLALAERSLAHAPANLSIYHNVACLYCKLGRREQALAAVRSAAEHEYPSLGELATDDDLLLLRDDPEFTRLVAPARALARARLDEALAELSRRCFRDQPVPPELAAFVSAPLRDLDLPGFLEAFLDEPPALDALPEPLRADLLTHVDWFARTSPVAWTGTTFQLGYLREAAPGAAPDAPRPVLSVATQTGDLRVSATLWHALTLLADLAWSPEQMRRDLGISASNLGVAPHALELATARAARQRLEPLIFEALAARVPAAHGPHEPQTGPHVAALAEAARRACAEAPEAPEAPRTVYLLQTEPRPWVAGQVSRSGGPPIGVDRHTRPRRPDGSYMAHLFTIDLRDAPALREHPLVRARPEARALALFLGAPLARRASPLSIDPRERALVLLSEEELARGEWRDEPSDELPRRSLSLTPLEVPAQLFASPLVRCGIDLARLWSLLCATPYLGGGRVAGARANDVDEDAFLLQFDHSIAAIYGTLSRGRDDRKLMYAVDGGAIQPRWSGPESREDRPAWLAALGWLGCALPWPTVAWADFARGPDSLLEQTLVRMCRLAEGRFALSFEMPDEDATLVHLQVGGAALAVRLEADACGEGVQHLVGELNQVLGQVAPTWRFAVAELGRTIRLLLVPTGWLDHVPEAVFEECLSGLEPGFARASPPRRYPPGPPPAAPEVTDVVGPRRVFARATSYAALLAEYLTSLGAFAGARDVQVTPRLLNADEGGVMHLSAKARNLQWTMRLPGASDATLSEAVDELNGFALRGRRRRLYAYRMDERSQGFVLASREEAETLRRWGHLCEDWRRQLASEALTKAGVELARYGRGSPALTQVVQRMAYLGRDVAPMQAAVDADRSVRFRVASLEHTVDLPADASERELSALLAALLPGLNDLCARAQLEHRWLLHRDRYVWRVVLASRPWAAQLAALFSPIAASLEPGFAYHGPAMLPIAHPRAVARPTLPILPRPEDLVPRKRLLSSDFKCSTRSTDFPDLLQELSTFAGLELQVEPVAQPDAEERHYTVLTTHEGAHHQVQIANYKYADVTPFLDFLNALLAAKRKRARLYQFHDANDHGVVLATPSQASALAAAGYVSLPP
ncbi:MAG: hypothetical protein R3B48_22380 [Kofleriaceae bacterium]